MTNPLSRRGFNHPAQGAAGDATLYSQIESIYQTIGDEDAFRWFLSASLANGATTTLTHGLRIAFSELTFRFYTYTGTFTPTTTELTRQAQSASGVSVIANVTNPTTQVDITNNTGGTINVGTLIAQMRYAEKLSDLSDVTLTTLNDGDTLTWVAGASKWENIAGSISTSAQDFTGLKRFLTGISSVEYVGTNPEVGGSSPFQLTVAHRRVQVINPAGAITVKLPTTTVKQGERWRIVNRSTFVVTLQSSGGNALGTIVNSAADFIALQDTPTTAAHWANEARFQEEIVRYVGNGPNAYSSLSAALVDTVTGDTIICTASFTETADISWNVANTKILFQPNVQMTLSGTITNGLRLTAANVNVVDANIVLAPTGAQAKGISIEAADCKITGWMELSTAQTLTDAVNINSSGVRAYVQLGVKRTLGTITNLETNADGAGKTDIWGG